MTLLSLFGMRLLEGSILYTGTGPILMLYSERAESEFGLIVLIKLSIKGQLGMVDSIYFKFVARLVCCRMPVGCIVEVDEVKRASDLDVVYKYRKREYNENLADANIFGGSIIF